MAIDDLGFAQGVTVVERMRTYDGRIFQLDRHLQRLARAVKELQITGVPHASAQRQMLAELLDRNRQWWHPQRDVGIVLWVTPGPLADPALRSTRDPAVDPPVPSPAAPGPTVAAYLTPLPQAVIERRLLYGQPLVITDVVQPSVRSWPRHWKVRSRLHYFLADRQATEVDADACGILLDEDGTVTETSIANLAVVQAGHIVSPPADRVLPGVTQTVAEEIAADRRIEWIKRPLSVDEVKAADELLLFGTTTGIWRGWLAAPADHGVRRGSAPRADGKSAGPVFRALRHAFDEVCQSAAQDDDA